MASVEHKIHVNVPVTVAYNQWTQFEEFPRFMEGVHSVKQIDDRHLEWHAEVGGHEKRWKAEIEEQVPDKHIIWRNIEGDQNAGIVRFESAGDQTEVHLEMSYNSQGFAESVGDALGFMNRRIKGDLERFKAFIEERGTETGSYRETLSNPSAPGGHTDAR